MRVSGLCDVSRNKKVASVGVKPEAGQCKFGVSFSTQCWHGKGELIIQFEALTMAALAAGIMKSVTLENNALEAAFRLQAAEIAFVPAAGETKQNRVQISINDDNGLATISVSLEVARSIEADGSVKYVAKQYC